jgi:hypothetical protein
MAPKTTTRRWSQRIAVVALILQQFVSCSQDHARIQLYLDATVELNRPSSLAWWPLNTLCPRDSQEESVENVLESAYTRSVRPDRCCRAR